MVAEKTFRHRAACQETVAVIQHASKPLTHAALLALRPCASTISGATAGILVVLAGVMSIVLARRVHVANVASVAVKRSWCPGRRTSPVMSSRD